VSIYGIPLYKALPRDSRIFIVSDNNKSKGGKDDNKEEGEEDINFD
jgi:hypothetical protein